MDKIACAIGVVVMAFGGFLVAVGVIGLLGWLVTFAWMMFSTNFRAILKTENLILEYRKNREKFLEWKENKETNVAVVNANQHKTLIGMYNDLREDFVDYVCSGVPNPAPYCQNRCEDCVDCHGWCKQDSDKCNGFNPADFII